MGNRHIERFDRFRTIPPFTKKDNNPSFLRDKYMYSSEVPIRETDLSDNQKAVIEIKCMNPACKTSIRFQGQRIGTVLSVLKIAGCPVCKHTDFKLYKVKN